MSDSTDDFFEGKRPWSVIKDQVLEGYMSPYIAKVIKRRQPILLIDGYAGPGVFEDGKLGSPMIMCHAAEKYARGNWKAIFINKKPEYHNKLTKIIEKAGWSSSVTTILGDTTKLLHTIYAEINNQSVFLYLDPFGPTGCKFALLQPFLNREATFSTEIMLTMHMPSMHRFASGNAVEQGRQNDPTIQDFHQTLTQVLGGDYWRDILLNKKISPEEQKIQLIEAYRTKLTQYFPFTRSCPVREKTDTHIKYFIVFASHHKDSLVLLNDIMVRAYFARMHKGDLGGGLWEDTDWREMRSIDGLDDIIVNIVAKNPGETRKSIWSRIAEEHFMRYLESEYTHHVQSLVDHGRLISSTPRKTKRLNEDCILCPSNRTS